MMKERAYLQPLDRGGLLVLIPERTGAPLTVEVIEGVRTATEDGVVAENEVVPHEGRIRSAHEMRTVWMLDGGV